MLKRLELIGFKSFADRTWFTFAPGLTAVVGPNGSGKSNVVDAVKWILGEQSAKNLRGGEMADVIFNGSATRRAVGVAEVTLTLENSNRAMNTDAAEVSVTRRVHRDGTGEYLINGQASRLRDVRELFLGSGAGSTAYCIIEQGRVDALLQASPFDRRAIFEEAAGISRFKARKVETLRKLEHTAENLTRLRDIFGEVEKQLRRVRLDAEKARRYQEHAVRLRELRLGVGLREFHALTTRLTAEQAELDARRSDLAAAQSQVAEWQSETEGLDARLASVDAEIATATDALSDTRRRVATLLERQANETHRAQDADAELTASRRRSIELSMLVRHLDAEETRSRGEVAAAAREEEKRQARADELDRRLTEVDEELASLQHRVKGGRDRQFHLVGRAAALNSDASSTKALLDKFHRDRDRKRRETEGKSAELAAVGRVLETLGHKDSDLQSRLSFARQTLNVRRAERDALRGEAAQWVETLEGLRVRRGGLAGRIEVLENLEKSQDGLGTGVREMLAELARPDSPFRGPVVGLVADAITVPRDLAPLIDIALGDIASHFVVRDPVGLQAALRARGTPFSGRVSFLPLRSVEPVDATDTADRWVTCDSAELTGLPRQLLGRTRIVDELPEAVGDLRCVSPSGELLETDGTLTVGPLRGEAGIVSRKAELRDLRSKAALLAIEITDAERRLADLRDRADSLAAPIHGLEEEIRALTSTASDLQTEILKQTQHRERLGDDIALLRQEWEMLEEEITRLDVFWRETRGKAEEAERQAEELRTQMETAENAIRGYETERASRQQEQTAARVALAETTQRLTGLRDAHQKLQSDLERGRSEAARLHRHEVTVLARRRDHDLSALRATATLAEVYGTKERLERESANLVDRREADRARRATAAESLDDVRDRMQQLLGDAHARELQAQQSAASRDRVADRLREDYQLELAAEYAASPLAKGDLLPGEWDDAVAATEIESLRRKIRHLGNVSLESLSELSEVEGRATELGTQIADLTAAEQSLRSVIGKINEDSKKLFAETYEAVRGHFQELFRKLFGGGMADIVLDSPDDVLETGVDIVARPPGKELRGLSLMSGGEKTLTAVALLLAIFRSKPSPFCLLDEVDAALDEANTERLAQTIRDFTDRSQFIVITHKKRTMAYADVLYGVTMQESGVSKQIAVRFDDWEDPQTQAA